MAKFIRIELEKSVVFVNADTVRYVQAFDSKPNRATIMFDDRMQLNVPDSAANLVRLFEA